jgi:6-phosphofructokinase 2
MKRIVTVTVNPTIDVNTRVDQVVPEKKLRCENPRREPGGGGVNVSRAIQRLGGSSTALYLAGGPTGDMLQQLLATEGLKCTSVPTEGWTRENFIVSESQSEQQFRFGMPGPDIAEREWSRCLESLREMRPHPDYIVASGSLSPGVPEDFFGRISVIAKESGSRLIVDTSGTPLHHAARAGAYLFKPNMAEFERLVGERLSEEREMAAAGRRLIEEGHCSVIVLSLGAGGALLITSEGSEHIRTPTVPVRSKVGAGDSMVAGIVLSLARGLDVPSAVRFGVAAGAAAVMTEGTELCRRDDTERLYEEIRNSSGSDRMIR